MFFFYKLRCFQPNIFYFMSKKNFKSSVKKAKKINAKPGGKAAKASKKNNSKSPAKKSKPAKSKLVSKKVSSSKNNKIKKVVAKKSAKPKAIPKSKKIAIKKGKVAEKKKLIKKTIQYKKPVKTKVVAKPLHKVIVKKTVTKPIVKPVEKTKKIDTPAPTLVKPIVKSKPLVTTPPPPKQPLAKIFTERTVVTKSHNEPAGKFELEYVIHSSPNILFEFLVSPSGLSEWFCDDVNIRNGIYTFFWDGSEQHANLVRLVEERLVRFQWIEKKDGSYFEFRIEKDDLTNDISLIITDFAETPEEKESSKLLWDSQIDKLLHVLGSFF